MMTSSNDTLQADGVLRIFGFDDAPFSVTVIPRSAQWRGLRATALLLAGVIPGFVMAIFPPHVVWPLLGIAGGTSLAILKWSERFTLVELSGSCPKCGSRLSQKGPGRFKPAGSVDCPNCRHTSQIVLHDGALPD